MGEAPQGEVIAQFEKNSREEVRVSVDHIYGRKVINIRVYYRNEAGEWAPGKQGIALAVERYRDLADAVLQLGEWLKSRHLLPSGGR
jgi:hypothetical protein